MMVSPRPNQDYCVHFHRRGLRTGKAPLALHHFALEDSFSAPPLSRRRVSLRSKTEFPGFSPLFHASPSAPIGDELRAWIPWIVAEPATRLRSGRASGLRHADDGINS